MKYIIATLAALHTTSVAVAQDVCEAKINSNFREGAPRDNFIIENTSSGEWQILSIVIDLENSDGKLIFDTQQGGDGVEVFQPYKTEAGDATLATTTGPEDGATSIKLEFTEFQPRQSFRFSIDVDDTLQQSDLGQIRVTGGELNGAELTATLQNKVNPGAKPLVINGFYNQANKTVVDKTGC